MLSVAGVLAIWMCTSAIIAAQVLGLPVPGWLFAVLIVAAACYVAADGIGSVRRGRGEPR